jgi:SAM-dependent methyltransferase
MVVKFDAEGVARLERMYATPAIAEQRARTRAALAPRPGERGLDVGCGPGFLACELARAVGEAGRIVAIDSSPQMLDAARARAGRERVNDRIQFARGDAVHLAFPAASFDFVVGVQVYLYVPELEQALADVARVLRPGGRFALVDTDWDSCVWLTGDRDRHRRVMEARITDFADAHVPPRVPGLLHALGLRVTHASVIPLLELSYDPGSFSGEMIGVAKRAAIRHGIPPVEAEAWEADLRRRTGNGDYFFSVNRYLFVATK